MLVKQTFRLRLWGVVCLAPFTALTAAFLLVPVVSMVSASFSEGHGGRWTFSHYATALTQLFYLRAIRNSVLISLFSSLIGLVVATVAAYSITRFTPAVRDRILVFSNMTSNFASVPLAFSYIVLLGNNGVFTLLFRSWGWDVFADFNLYSWTGLILVYAYFQIPLAVLLLYPAFYSLREEWKEAAALLGATAVRFWTTVGLPCLAPALFGTAGILFANAMGAYATAYALVGSNYNLLAVRIGSLVAGDVVTRPELGSALAVLLAATTIAAVLVNEALMRRMAGFTSPEGRKAA